MKVLKILLSLLLIGILGCQSKDEKEQSAAKTKIICNPYFEFDEVDHYSIQIEEPEIWKTYEKKKKTKDEKRFIEIILQDTIITTEIEKSGYLKNVISKEKFQSLNSIFCERKHKNSFSTTCIAFYRDVLIFKKQGKITGSAKICFECYRGIISETEYNTAEFGASGDYGRLKKLLYN